MSLFLQAVYSESLYLLCCLGAFALAERRQWLGTGVVTGLAMLTRFAGVALLLPMLLLAWRSPERKRALLSLVSAPALAALYPLWLELKLHAVFAAYANEAGWGRHLSPAGPFGGLWHSLEAAWTGITQIVTGDSRMQAGAHNLEYLAFFLVFLWLGVEAWRRLGAPYGLFVLGSLAIPLSAPTGGYPLLSMPRFCLVLFPAFLALAAIANTEGRNRAILVVSSFFLAVAVVEVVGRGSLWASRFPDRRGQAPTRIRHVSATVLRDHGSFCFEHVLERLTKLRASRVGAWPPAWVRPSARLVPAPGPAASARSCRCER